MGTHTQIAIFSLQSFVCMVSLLKLKRSLTAASDKEIKVVNLTESIPSIHTGPAEFKRMIAPTSPQKSENLPNEFTEQLFLQKMQQLQIKSSRKKPSRTSQNEKSSQMNFLPAQYTGPANLTEALGSLGLSKYEELFLNQDIDLQVFLTLNEKDLKEIGVKLFGPRRKMTTFIARINEGMRSTLSPIEKSFADRLTAEVAKLKDQIAQNEQENKSDKQLLKQEKQLRFIAEQCYQETQIKNEQLMQIMLSITTELGNILSMNDPRLVTEHLKVIRSSLERHLNYEK